MAPTMLAVGQAKNGVADEDIPEQPARVATAQMDDAVEQTKRERPGPDERNDH